MGILLRFDPVLCQVKCKKPKLFLWIIVHKHVKAKNSGALQTSTCFDRAAPVAVCLHATLTPAYIVQGVKRQ